MRAKSILYLYISCVLSLLLTACPATQTPINGPAPDGEAAGQDPAGDPASPAAAPTATPSIATSVVERPAPLAELIRVRCASDGSDVYTTWTGKIFSFAPGERQRLLFRVVGMNVIRCWQDGEQWTMTSRELMYYLDPTTGEVLDRWTNPWTGETVPVMHVANSPVQSPLRGPVPMKVANGRATIVLDIPLFYPNRLSKDPQFAAYSPQPNYLAGEFFALSAPLAQVEDASATTVSEMTFTWHRYGPWLPWMKMGDRPGSVVYSAHGSKVTGYDQIPDVIRKEIDSRLALYRTAARCMLDRRNETSWSYFAAHFAKFLAGERFPVDAPAVEEACKPGSGQ